MPVNLASVIAGSAAVPGLLIACALWLTQGRRVYANRILAVGVLLSVSYLLSLVSMHSPAVTQLLPLRLGGISIFLFGPALYLYVRALCEPRFRLRWVDAVHAMPYLLLLLDNALLLIPGRSTQYLIVHPQALGVLYYVLMVAYLLAATLRLHQYHREVRNTHSSLEGVSLNWLATLLAISLVLTLPGLVFALGRWLFDVISWPQGLWSIALMVSTYYLIAFFAITRPAVFNPPEQAIADPVRVEPDAVPILTPDAAPPAARYETSSLSGELAIQIYQELEGLMAERRPFLDNQLKIADLAALIALPVNHLSQTINQVGGCSFFEYINRYRVNATRAMLLDPQQRELTMLEIAMEAGFNSESVFYKQFKKHTGLTPRQFRHQNLVNS